MTNFSAFKKQKLYFYTFLKSYRALKQRFLHSVFTKQIHRLRQCKKEKERENEGEISKGFQLNDKKIQAEYTSSNVKTQIVLKNRNVSSFTYYFVVKLLIKE